MSCPTCFSRSALAAFVAVALVAGCGDSFPTAESDDVAVVDDVTNDIGSVDAGDPDAAKGDTTLADTSEDGSAGDVLTDGGGDALTDGGGDTLTDGGDSTDAGPACPGAATCACKEDKDCDSKACVLDGEGKKACAKPCKTDSDCGDDVCQDVSGVNVCVPAGAALCAPCVSNNECTYGDAKGACVAAGGAGNFCGTSCSADADCAKGYSCKDGKDVEGNDVKQCVPEKDAVCSCTGYGLAKQAKTTCFAAGLPGCTSTRQCLADGETGAPAGGGLTECTPQKPVDETCDGMDNDCDGQTDEDGTALCDDKNGCTTDTCGGGKGCENKKLDGDSCDDGNACTKGDTCAVGLCTGATVDCDDSNPCTSDACDMASGCTNTNTTDKCDDGSACTKDDTCAAGLCAGVTVTCDDSNPCTTDSCDLATGCTTTNNTDKCDDSSACTKDDTCAVGLCAGVTVDCDDNNPCTTDSCDTKTGCVNKTLDGDKCDDGSACTTTDVCDKGKCTGAKLDCDDANPCTDDACDMTSGCTSTNNDKTCDDGSACSDNDGCVGGKCGGTPKSCEDGNACTDDSCDPKTGCKFVQNTKPCNDGVACSVQDTCKAGKCVGTPKKCDDGNACTADSCDTASGNCLFKPLVGDKCDDGNACTTKDACDKDGKCAGGAKLVCEDGNQCTDDPCDPAKGCADKILTKKPCNDGSVCTKTDTCDGAGKCVGTALSCDDGNPCTDDSCDKLKGCQKTNNTAKCDDGDICTTGDVCAGGKCKSGSNACQCKADSDCVGQGSNLCNGALVCKANKCVVDPKNVVQCKDDNNACTSDACNPGTGKCDYAAVKDGSACDADGSKCTEADACKAGKCEAGKPLNCDDNNACTADTCDKVKGCSNTNVTTGGVTVITFNSYPGKDGKLGTADDLKVNKDDGVADQFKSVGVSFKLVGGGVPRVHVSGSIVKPYAPNTLRPVDPKVEVKAENYKDIELILTKPAKRVKVMVLDVHTNEASAVKAYNLKGELIGEKKHPGAPGGNIIPLEVTVDGSKGWIARVVVDLTQSTGSAAGPELYDNFEFEWAPTCEDGNICTTPDICAGGKCATGPVKVCDDGNQCTKDSCDAKSGCKHAALDKVPCEDGNKCTDGDACATGKCVSGKPKGCDDGKPCTKDACDPKTGCVSTPLKDGDACEDGSKCTGKDACQSGKCVPGAKVVCNDGDICTLDSCDPVTGCKASPIAGCGTKPFALPYTEPFACGSASSKLWKLAGSQKAPAWAVDGTPASVKPFSGSCTLNFNDGTNYGCKTGSTKLLGTADSPAIDLTKAKLPTLTFQLNGDWESNNFDELYVQITTDGGKTFKTLADLNDNGSIKWVKMTYDLSAYAGKVAQLRFRFYTDDCIGNSTVGPFVDDVMIEDIACTKNADCNDGNTCSVDTCSLSTGKCLYASVKNGTKCEDGNLCTLNACNNGKCGIAGNVKCIDDGDACTVGETCSPKTGKCAPTYIETCNDNNPCTSDTCNKATAGCTHQSLKVCAPKCSTDDQCNDNNPCTVDTCGKDGVCAWTPAKAGTVCGDGKVCGKANQCVNITGGWARQISSDGIGYHYCAVTADAKVACWGRNNYYQTGFPGSTSNRTTPFVVPGVSNVKSVETGRYHSCAVTSIGEVYCWGRNNYRQSAPSSSLSTTPKATKVAGLLGVRSIAAGYDYTCAHLSDRRVSCWGYNNYGQQGRGNTTPTTKPTLVPNLTGVLSLSADYSHVCAVRSDGGLWCAGMNFDYQTHQTSGTKTVFTKRGGAPIPTLSKTVAGYGTTCGAAGTGWACVGNNTYGAMGNGNTTDAALPVNVDAGGADIADIGTGYYANFALTLGGDVWGSGYDAYGAFGLATTVTTRSKYVKTGFGKAVDVDGGYRNACVLSPAGAVFCSGYNTYGGLGNGSTSSSTSPVTVKGPCTSAAMCNDGDPCTIDACTAGACAWSAGSGAKCDDGDACTNADACSAGKCVGKAVICDDKNACTQGDKCAVQGGSPVCVPGVLKKCDDGDKCTADSCDAGTGKCVFKPIVGCTIACKVDADCDDNNGCTTNSCVSGACQKKNANEGKLCGGGKVCGSGVCAGSGKGWAKAIASNTYALHACAIGTDTKLYCWGDGSDNRLGQTSTSDQLKPKAVPGLSGVTDVEVGYSHTCAKVAGKWWCFGDNFYGALGTGVSGSDTAKPQEVKAAANVVDMALGYRFSCALLASGKVNCFGYGSGGRLGNGTTSSSAKAVEVKGVANATAVWAGYDHACARLADGTAKCWGLNGEYAVSNASTSTTHSTPVVKAGATQVLNLAGYYSGTCWTTFEGKAFCTGDNDNGQLGSKSPTDQSAPLQLVGPTDVFHVEGGANHLVALSGTGKVWTAGYNFDGQLGNGTKSTSTTFITPKLNVIGQPVQVAAGYNFTCVLTSEGQVGCTGNGSNGEQGDGSTSDDTEFTSLAGPCSGNTQCNDNNPCTSDACVAGSCAFTNTSGGACNDGVACTGKDTCSGGVCKGTPVLCNDNDACTVGDACQEGKDGKPVCVPGKKKSCDDNNTCTNDSCDAKTGSCVNAPIVGCVQGCKTDADCDDGNLCTANTCLAGKCASKFANDGLVCSEGKTCNSGACAGSGQGWAATISGAPYGQHFCALGTDGNAWCWGNGGDGRLGDGSTQSNSKPNMVSTIKDLVAVYAFYRHSCAIDKAGKAWCWGNNFYGELGTGSTGADSLTPKAVTTVTDAVKLAGGSNYTCALRKTGTVTCWGYGYNGRLGYGSTSSTNQTKGVTVKGLTDVVDVQGFSDHACATKKDGTVWCWGENYDRPLVDTSTTRYYAPVQKTDAKGAYSVDGARDNVCWVSTKGVLACTGDNDNGQLGNKGTSDSGKPVVAPMKFVSGVAGGYDHNLALTADGKVWAVGDNDQGQLGVGSKTDSKSWVASQVPGGAKIVQADAASDTTCLLTSLGQVMCTGDGYWGQLGTGSTADVTSYVSVAGPCTGNKQCNDGNPCTQDVCKAGACSFTGTSGGTCSDGDACTTSDVCSSGKCVGKTVACDDKNACTVGDKCEVQSGNAVCVPGKKKTCDDGDPCTADSCSTLTGACTFTPIKGCLIGCKSDADCDNGDPCTIDACNTTTGGCTQKAAKDGLLCAEGGQCKSGKCSAITAGWARDIEADPSGEHICALTHNKTMACWGMNTDGQIGNGSKTDVSKPVIVKVGDVEQMAVGSAHTCALNSKGALYCWGYRYYGQTGDGFASSTDQTTPKLASKIPTLADVWAGYHRTCGLDLSGKLWCWGYGSSGDRGDGTTTSSMVNPAAVQGLPGNIVDLDIRARRGCAQTQKGELYCWGYNLYRDVAPSSTSTMPIATKRAAPTDVGIFGGGRYTQCAGIIGKGQLQCWGDNSDGQVGNGSSSFTAVSVPVVAKGLTIPPIAINGGDDHIVILGTNGKVFTSGDSADRQTGNGTTTDKKGFSQASKFTGSYVKALGFYNTTCALGTDGQVYCLGDTSDGQVGAGKISFTDVNDATKVIAPAQVK